MFGRRHKEPRPGGELEVDVNLEDGLTITEQWIDHFLDSPTPENRAKLLAVLKKLDDRLERADYFTNRANSYRSGYFGVTATNVIGATGANAPCEEVPATEFQAQADLIKAAKRAVTEPGPDSLDALKRSRDALRAIISQLQAVAPETAQQRPRQESNPQPGG